MCAWELARGSWRRAWLASRRRCPGRAGTFLRCADAVRVPVQKGQGTGVAQIETPQEEQTAHYRAPSPVIEFHETLSGGLESGSADRARTMVPLCGSLMHRMGILHTVCVSRCGMQRRHIGAFAGRYMHIPSVCRRAHRLETAPLRARLPGRGRCRSCTADVRGLHCKTVVLSSRTLRSAQQQDGHAAVNSKLRVAGG
jgi:hypothetical protein